MQQEIARRSLGIGEVIIWAKGFPILGSSADENRKQDWWLPRRI